MMEEVFYIEIPTNGFEVKMEHETSTVVGSKSQLPRFFVLQNTLRKCTKMCVTRACSMIICPSFLKLANIIGRTNKIIVYSRCSMKLNTFGCRTLQNSIMKEFELHLSLWWQCEQVYNNNILYLFFPLKIISARILRSYSTTRIG